MPHILQASCEVESPTLGSGLLQWWIALYTPPQQQSAACLESSWVRFIDATVQEKVTFGGGSIMVWVPFVCTTGCPCTWLTKTWLPFATGTRSWPVLRFLFDVRWVIINVLWGVVQHFSVCFREVAVEFYTKSGRTDKGVNAFGQVGLLIKFCIFSSMHVYIVHLVTTGILNGKRSRGRLREKILDIWPIQADSIWKLLDTTRDREKLEGIIAYASRHGTWKRRLYRACCKVLM